MDAWDPLPLLEGAGRLKRLPRAGWVEAGIPAPESVADHSYRLALLAAIVAHHLGLDAGHAALLALVHDLGEAVTGDLTPRGVADRAAKLAAEGAAVRSMAAALGAEAPFVVDLWREAEEGRGPEAGLLRELDKAEMALQALDYRAEGFPWERLRPLWEYALARLATPEVRRLVERALAGRGGVEGR